MSLLPSIKEYLDLWSITPEEAWQPCLDVSTKSSSQRQTFWEYYKKQGFDFVYRKYFTDSYKVRLKRQIKRH